MAAFLTPTKIINGVKLVESNDMVVRAYEKRGSFEPESCAIWNELASQKGVTIDIGAYTGVYAIAAALRGSKSIAFEPNPHAAKRLYLNAANNRVEVEIKNMAAWNTSERLMLNLKKGNLLTSSSSLVTLHETNFSVLAMPVDWFQFENVKVIKIDAERAEIEVLQGAKVTIEENLPVLLIEELDRDMNKRIGEEIGFLGYRSEKLTQSMTVWRQ